MIPLPPAFLERPLAHRALHGPGRPENSVSAMQAAVSHGYGIEIDLQLSQDHEALVFHDNTLDRLTQARGPLADRGSDELAKLPLLGGSGEGVPRLADVLDIVAGQVPLLIELKDQDGALGPKIGALEEATVAALRGYDGPVGLMSFNPHAVAKLAELAPHLPRGLTTDPFTQVDWPAVPEARRRAHAAMSLFSDVGASFISHNREDLAAPEVSRIKNLGWPVLCWTIRSAAEAKAALTIADNITFEGFQP
ncbi:glycerophosphodiester phosphodiesterase family protein [Roseobacteraceae bacterium S113]